MLTKEVLEQVMSGALDPEAAEKEAEEARKRIAELKKRQKEGKLTKEELAELERLEGRLAVLENVVAAGKKNMAGAGGPNSRDKGAQCDDLGFG